MINTIYVFYVLFLTQFPIVTQQTVTEHDILKNEVVSPSSYHNTTIQNDQKANTSDNVIQTIDVKDEENKVITKIENIIVNNELNGPGEEDKKQIIVPNGQGILHNKKNISVRFEPALNDAAELNTTKYHGDVETSYSGNKTHYILNSTIIKTEKDKNETLAKNGTKNVVDNVFVLSGNFDLNKILPALQEDIQNNSNISMNNITIVYLNTASVNNSKSDITSPNITKLITKMIGLTVNDVIINILGQHESNVLVRNLFLILDPGTISDLGTNTTTTKRRNIEPIYEHEKAHLDPLNCSNTKSNDPVVDVKFRSFYDMVANEKAYESINKKHSNINLNEKPIQNITEKIPIIKENRTDVTVTSTTTEIPSTTEKVLQMPLKINVHKESLADEAINILQPLIKPIQNFEHELNNLNPLNAAFRLFRRMKNNE